MYWRYKMCVSAYEQTLYTVYSLQYIYNTFYEY